jgi:hypothetical protein
MLIYNAGCLLSLQKSESPGCDARPPFSKGMALLLLLQLLSL